MYLKVLRFDRNNHGVLWFVTLSNIGSAITAKTSGPPRGNKGQRWIRLEWDASSEDNKSSANSKETRESNKQNDYKQDQQRKFRAYKAYKSTGGVFKPNNSGNHHNTKPYNNTGGNSGYKPKPGVNKSNNGGNDGKASPTSSVYTDYPSDYTTLYPVYPPAEFLMPYMSGEYAAEVAAVAAPAGTAFVAKLPDTKLIVKCLQYQM